MTRPSFFLSACVAAATLGMAAAPAPGSAIPKAQVAEEVFVKTVAVPGDAGWVDTGLDVAQGEAWTFRATGQITLQRGNPAADCGPEGLDFMTVQQPVPDSHIGALIGKVAQLISVRVDEETGQEIRDEIVSLFPIGSERDILAPIRGRLFLGVNENVVRDNGGLFLVSIFRRQPGRDQPGLFTSRR